MLRTLLLCLGFLSVAPAAVAQSLQAVLQDNAEAVAQSSRGTVEAVIAALAEAAPPGVPAFLEAWRDNGVWRREADGLFTFVVAQGDEFVLTDPDGGAAERALAGIATRLGASRFADLSLDALSLASIYFLAAIGLAITFGVMGVIDMAHGEFIMLGAYTGYLVQLFIPDYTVSIIVALPVAFAMIVVASLQSSVLPPTPQEVTDAIGSQIFSVVGSADFPAIWEVSHSLTLLVLAAVLAPGLLALIFGGLAFRSRVTGVYLSILTQAMILALSHYFYQNDTGLRGNNGLSGLQNIPGFEDRGQAVISLRFFGASALALGPGYVHFAWIVSGRFGSVIRAIRDDEARVRFLGYHVDSYKLFVFTVTAMVAGIAGALYYPQADIINPAEIAPIASIYLAVWVAIGGRGRL